jgi:hypothetical protein
VIPEDELYIVNWHTDEFGLDPEKVYRVRVFVGAIEVGFADVDLVNSGGLLKNVDTGEFIPLLDGRTLPIKFRLEVGVLPPVTFEAAHGVQVGNNTTPLLPGVNITGANRLLICAVSIEPRTSAVTVSSLVLDDGAGNGAQVLTQLGDYYAAPSDGLKWSTWYLTGATLGAGRRVIGSFSSSVFVWQIACVSYSGVDQGNPLTLPTVSVGTGGAASLTVNSNRDGSVPWAHLFSSNSGYVAGAGVTNRQKSTTHIGFEFSYLVDGNTYVNNGGAHTFNWSYNGNFGGQGAMIRGIAP